MTNGVLPGVTTGGTLNVYSAARDVIGYPVMAPDWMDLSLGFAYCIMVANTTDNDIDSGEISIEGAEADPDDQCRPGPFRPLDPVADCGPLVTGIPWDPPVRIPITPQHPIRARAVCMFAVPCPLQFMRVTGVPAGTHAWGIVTRLRRTNFDHAGPYGGVVPPMQLMNPLQAQLPGAQQQTARVTAPQQQPQQQPQQAPPPPAPPPPPLRRR